MILAALALVAQASAPATASKAVYDPVSGAGAVIGECLMASEAQPTRAAFIEQVRKLGRAAAVDPVFTRAGLTVDDADGRGCRVRFHANAEQVAKFSEAAAKIADGPHPPSQPILQVTREPDPRGGEAVIATIIDMRP